MADSGNNRVHHRNGEDGSLIRMIGTSMAEGAVGSLQNPTGVAVIGGSVAVVDGKYGGNHRLTLFHLSDGTFDRELPTPEGFLQSPYGIAVNLEETCIALADYNDGIHLIAPDSSQAPTSITPKSSPLTALRGPRDVTFSPDGQQILVADESNSRICVMGLDGACIRDIGLPSYARGVTVDRRGNIIALMQGHFLRSFGGKAAVFSSHGELLQGDLLRGVHLSRAGAAGLAMHLSSGRIAVSDAVQNCIYF